MFIRIYVYRLTRLFRDLITRGLPWTFCCQQLDFTLTMLSHISTYIYIYKERERERKT